MNETLQVFGQALCASCAEAHVERLEAPIAPEAVVRQFDPTVCGFCQADGGAEEWAQQVAGVPACLDCEQYLRRRPFPGWVKLAFAVLVMLAVISVVHNWHFVLAHVENLQARRAFKEGDVARGMALMESAAERVPEIPEMAAIANIMRAQRLMAEEKSAEAVALLRGSIGAAPPPLQAFHARALLNAEMAVAFDQKDYDTFLDKSKEFLKRVPDDPMSAGSVASAYACKYIVTGNDAFKQEALGYLEKARGLAKGHDPAWRDYEERLQHRLETKEIISQQEFRKRFPQGWKKGA